jgi:hypothetical protein
MIYENPPAKRHSNQEANNAKYLDGFEHGYIP